MKGVLSSGMTWSGAERKNLRVAHINPYFEVNGKIYIPAGGLTSAGTSLTNAMSVQRMFRAIKWFRKQLSDDPNFLKNATARSGSSFRRSQIFISRSLKRADTVWAKAGLRFRLAWLGAG